MWLQRRRGKLNIMPWFQGAVMLSTDASAAKGIAMIRGKGKVRHIEVSQLWVQDKVRNKDIILTKVPGTINIADALTKHLAREDIVWHMAQVCQVYTKGRHKIAPNPETIEGDRKEEEEEEDKNETDEGHE